MLTALAVRMVDITGELAAVHGGNRGRAIAATARAAWNVAKPYIKEAGEQIASVAGSVVLDRAVERVGNWWRGNNAPAQDT